MPERSPLCRVLCFAPPAGIVTWICIVGSSSAQARQTILSNLQVQEKLACDWPECMCRCARSLIPPRVHRGGARRVTFRCADPLSHEIFQGQTGGGANRLGVKLVFLFRLALRGGGARFAWQQPWVGRPCSGPGPDMAGALVLRLVGIWAVGREG